MLDPSWPINLYLSSLLLTSILNNRYVKKKKKGIEIEAFMQRNRQANVDLQTPLN